MDSRLLDDWLRRREGIAHRSEARRAGIPVATIRALTRAGRAQVIRRQWIALPEAPAELVLAARAGGRLTCTSLARRRGWWIPEVIDDGVHLHLHPHAASARVPPDWGGRLHWSIPLAPHTSTSVAGTVVDALAHIAVCLPYDTALILWESAAQREKLAPLTLRGIPWTTRRGRELAESVTGLSDSGIETDLFAVVRGWRVAVRQQVKIAGHRVDLLIGDWLVVQADGFEFHATSEQRTRDIAHDAELRLRGYTVLRFSYHQVVRGRRQVEETLRLAIAQGLHVRPATIRR